MNEEVPHFCPADQEGWRKWLDQHHATHIGVWLIMYKKDSATPNLNWSEAVDEALCFGWIDSTKRPIDSEKYTQYFGRRKPGSTWSKINKEKVRQLIEDGRMKPAGLASVALAKENGSWTLLDEVEELIIPTDLEAAFKKHPGSMDYFQGLSKSARKSLLHWIVTAKRPETRQNRIDQVSEHAGKGQKPKQFS